MRWLWFLLVAGGCDGAGLLGGLLGSLSGPKGPDCAFTKWDSRDTCPLEKDTFCRASKTTCPCGSCVKLFESKIVGGTRVDSNEHCYLVGLLKAGTCKKFCAGTIICEQWVLTAAHCLVSMTPQDVDVLAGTIHIDPEDCEAPPAERRKVTQIVNHPRYSHEIGWPADISLMKVDRKFIRGQTVGFACLPPLFFNLDSRLEKRSTLIGWGQTEDGTQSAHLLKACTKQMDWKCCDPAVDHLLLTDHSQFCTYDKSAGLCQGDSGGGVVYHDEQSRCNVVYGVVSWGPADCSRGMPDVCTNIHPYLPWIKQVTGDECQLCNIIST